MQEEVVQELFLTSKPKQAESLVQTFEWDDSKDGSQLLDGQPVTSNQDDHLAIEVSKIIKQF